MARRSAHVTRVSARSWRGRTTGPSKVTVRAKTQRAAVNKTRAILRRSGGGELVTHGRNGRIRAKNTIPPARDPYPPRG